MTKKLEALPAIPNFISDGAGKYQAAHSLTEAQIISAARALLNKSFCPGQSLTSPDITSTWLQLHYMELQHEVFICLFLDNQHRVIKHEILFKGTVDGASIYPREVAKRCLKLNASAVVFAHNHPSGIAEPSAADRRITDKLKEVLGLFDIRTLDHFIVGREGTYSFAEHGLI